MNDKRRQPSTITALFLIMVLTLAAPAMATSSSGIRVEIVSGARGVLSRYPADGGSSHSHRSYIIARNNDRYSIRVRNMTGERIGLVIAVDGRNIISGQRSDLAPHERMYILGPHQAGEYEGWRTGSNRVNRFYFTNHDNSYAAAWGDYSAMGVIAVAAYREQQRDVFRPRPKGRLGKPKEPGGPKVFGREPGTGFGETEWSPSRTVRFKPERKPFSRQFIKYEYQRSLCRRGIIDCRNTPWQKDRNRFWPDFLRENGFAPYPPGRRSRWIH